MGNCGLRRWISKQPCGSTGIKANSRPSPPGCLRRAAIAGHQYLQSWADVQARYGVLPEGFDYSRFAPDRVTNELRPEFVDSCLNLFLLEPDGRWRELGRAGGRRRQGRRDTP